jgi:hypothetical protein
MIRALTELRALATLRRIAVAMERANQLEEKRQEIDYAPLRDAGKPVRKSVISRPSPGEWNRLREKRETPDDAA